MKEEEEKECSWRRERKGQSNFIEETKGVFKKKIKIKKKIKKIYLKSFIEDPAIGFGNPRQNFLESFHFRVSKNDGDK